MNDSLLKTPVQGKEQGNKKYDVEDIHQGVIDGTN
jgi:hypothetical protein